MNYPKNITLTKLNTLDDAEHPQKEKYPDGFNKTGLMWEHSEPKVGQKFFLFVSKMHATFVTSTVKEIIHQDDDIIMFITRNSKYTILIHD